MPSPNPRIQVCAEPALYAQVATIAASRNVSVAFAAAQLIDLALSQPEIRQELNEVIEERGVCKEQPDMRKRARTRPHYRDWSCFELTYRDEPV